MLRLTLMLCIGMFAALMIAGEDRGQMRPGLAEAAARKAAPQSEDKAVTLAETDSAAPAVQPGPVTKVAAAVEAEAPVVARAEPKPYVEPVREIVTEVEEPVFSLASVGNEAVPATPETEAVAGGEGTIWYVNADQVNVRASPSTNAEVLDKLGAGEATLVVQAVDADWARIVIQGDGVEGFVAMRYLSPEAP